LLKKAFCCLWCPVQKFAPLLGRLSLVISFISAVRGPDI
jgi:hypothetical protein